MPCTCSGCGTADGSLLIRLFPVLPQLWGFFSAELCWSQARFDVAGVASPCVGIERVCPGHVRGLGFEVFFCRMF